MSENCFTRTGSSIRTIKHMTTPQLDGTSWDAFVSVNLDHESSKYRKKLSRIYLFKDDIAAASSSPSSLEQMARESGRVLFEDVGGVMTHGKTRRQLQERSHAG